MNTNNIKTIISLATVTVLTLFAAVWLSNAKMADDNGTKNEALIFADLSNNINSLTSITLYGAEAKPLVKLEKQAEQWLIPDKANYPVDAVRLKTFLLNLADTKTVEAKTNNPEHYAELGLLDINNKAATGVLITLANQTQTWEVIVGQTSKHGSGSFIRKPIEAQSWLTNNNLIIDRNPMLWLDNTLLSIKSERIAEINLKKAGSPALHLVKAQKTDAHFSIVGNDSPKNPGIQTNFDNLAMTLNSMSFQDVMSDSAVTLPAESALSTANYRTFDGLTFDLTVWTQDNKHYLAIKTNLNVEVAKAAIKADLENASAQADDKQKETDATQKLEAGLNAIKMEFADLQARFAGRYFVVPNFKYHLLTKTLPELVQP